MINFFRWLIGYVNFTFSGGFCEGFINDCFRSDLNIHNIVKNEDCLCGNASIFTYKKLSNIAQKNGGKVEIVKKCGPVFPLLKLRNRWGILVGAVAFIMIVCCMSGFVWNIQITGNEKIPNAQIMEYLEDNNFTIGTRWNNIKKDNIESGMMATFDDCAWVHINQKGSTAIVEINETVNKPKIANTKNPTNLKAIKDGIIVKSDVYGGWKVLGVGDSVVKGDLLVSGVYVNEDKKENFFAHGSGEYIAKVQEDVKIVVSRNQTQKVYTDTLKYKTLNFFGLNIPLYFGSSKYMNCDESEKTNNIVINNYKIPIGITTKTVKLYNVTNISLTDKQLTQLTKDEIAKQKSKRFKNYEIISQNIDIQINADQAVAKGQVMCLENIGKEFKIYNAE